MVRNVRDALPAAVGDPDASSLIAPDSIAAMVYQITVAAMRYPLWVDPLSAACGAVAIIMTAYRAYTLLRARLDATMLLKVVKKLIANDDIGRAVKLCSATEHAVVAAACKAGLLRSGDRDDGFSGRQARVGEAYSKELKERLGRLGRGAIIGWAGGALGLAAVVFGVTAQPISPLTAILGASAIASAVFSSWLMGRLRHDGADFGQGLVSALVAHWTNTPSSTGPDSRSAREQVEEIGGQLGLSSARENLEKPAEPVAVMTTPRPPPAEVARPRMADMRRGTCAVCAGDDITESPDPARPGFTAVVCRGCGFAQLFATVPAKA